MSQRNAAADAASDNGLSEFCWCSGAVRVSFWSTPGASRTIRFITAGIMSEQSTSSNLPDDNRPAASAGPNRGSTTGKDAYNIVSDTVVGMNIRKSDNLFQLKVILVCVLIGVPLGAIPGALLLDPADRLAGALVGGIGAGFAGLVLG